MAVYFSDLQDFGQGVSIKNILIKWQMFFESKYTVDQIIFALYKHCEQSDIMPRVSHINKVLSPKPPKVTEAQYIAAQDYQKRNNYPMMSDAAETIELYRAQQKTAQSQYEINNEEIQMIVKNSIKKISEKT